MPPKPPRSTKPPKPMRKNNASTNRIQNNKQVRMNRHKPSVQQKRAERRIEHRDEEPSFNLYGRNAVLEALSHDKPIDRVLLKKGSGGSLRVIAAKAREKKIIVQEVEANRLEELAGGLNHQGVVAICPPQAYASIEEILSIAKERGQDPLILILDGISDPHNLGAIIRTAEVAGVHGVIIPKRRAVGLTPIVAKVAAGALAHMAVARVGNIVAVIEDLKRRGVWIGAACIGDTPMEQAPLTGPLALVIGAEGEGVSRLVRERCDFGASITTHGNITSLNASVATGILLYQALHQRHPHNQVQNLGTPSQTLLGVVTTPRPPQCCP